MLGHKNWGQKEGINQQAKECGISPALLATIKVAGK
jgi:hypothetical protein